MLRRSNVYVIKVEITAENIDVKPITEIITVNASSDDDAKFTARNIAVEKHQDILHHFRFKANSDIVEILVKDVYNY